MQAERPQDKLKEKLIKTKKKLKPEKIVEKEILATCSDLGLDMSIVDSKMFFSEKAGRYRTGETESGFADLAGNDSNGIACFIELKARGKMSTLRPNQRAFLVRKAEAGCFACAVDRAEVLVELFLAWKKDGKAPLLRYLEQI